MYITGLFVYIDNAKDVDGINLLLCESKTVRTERGILNVEGTKDNLSILSVFAGVFFPITWIIVILGNIILILSKIVYPITKFLINKNKKFNNENN